MQRQQLLSSVIKLFYCPKTKVIATSGLSEGANGNIKQKTNKRDHFQNNCRVPCWIWWRHSRLFGPAALIGNHKHPATEKNKPTTTKKKNPGGTISGLYLPKKWREWELLLLHFPFPPYSGAPLGKCWLFTLRMTQMVCALYNMAAALNMNAALRWCPLTTFLCHPSNWGGCGSRCPAQLIITVIVIYKSSTEPPQCM